jgi:hypothetical protein
VHQKTLWIGKLKDKKRPFKCLSITMTRTPTALGHDEVTFRTTKMGADEVATARAMVVGAVREQKKTAKTARRQLATAQRAAERRDELLAYIKAHPGCRWINIRDALGGNKVLLAGARNALEHEEQIVQRDGRWFAKAEAGTP